MRRAKLTQRLLVAALTMLTVGFNIAAPAVGASPSIGGNGGLGLVRFSYAADSNAANAPTSRSSTVVIDETAFGGSHGAVSAPLANPTGRIYDSTSVSRVAPRTPSLLDDATAPVGRRGNPIDIAPGTNARTTIGGREYSGHALDRMQGQGITPSVVDNSLTTSNAVTGKVPGTTAYYDAVNDLTVITDTASGRVVTVDYGRIRQ